MQVRTEEEYYSNRQLSDNLSPGYNTEETYNNKTISTENQIYNEPIYELTEENLSDRQTPQRNGTNMSKRFSTRKGLDSQSELEEKRGRKLLIVTIEIGNGEQENLTIFENDDPQLVAEHFCIKHQIDAELQDIITLHIRNSIIETKSKILKQERSHSMTMQSNDPEIEIPLDASTESLNNFAASPKVEHPQLTAVTVSQEELITDDG